MEDRYPGAPGSAASARGARPATARRHNLSAVLTLLHRSGPLTRAELTRRTGLNRSTVGDLVAELAEGGLVFETADTDRSGVGRPSPLVHANGKVVALALNPDVDAMVVGLVGLGGVVHRRLRRTTRSRPTVAQTVKLATRLVEELAPASDGCRVVGVGVAVPGLVRVQDGVVALAPHLDWHEEALAARLSEALGYPAFAGNDANLGLVAETVFGAGQGVGDLVYLNGSSSGIGGGVFAGGRPLWGSRGFAAELGHTLIRSGGQPCHCGKRGCLETEVNLSRLLPLLGAESLDPAELAARLVDLSDRRLRAELYRQLDLLGEAIAGFASVFNPELVVLGGFLAALHQAAPARIGDCVTRLCFPAVASSLRVESAKLGADLLLVGAAELALEPLLAEPLGPGARAATT